MRGTTWLLIPKYLFILLHISFISLTAISQQKTVVFSELGSERYKNKIVQLEKYTVPKTYQIKDAQAWYEEILTDRNKSLLSMFKENKLVYDTLLLNKCNSILQRIIAANSAFRFDTIQLYINRSIVANAACYGEGTVIINAGLFLWIDNDDELALVLAHEFAHQLLDHSSDKIGKSIKIVTSDDFKTALKDIKKADYGKYDRFRKLMKDLNIESGRHSTYKEGEADSLGAVLIKNAGFNVPTAAAILLKLDKVDELFTSDGLYSLKDFFGKTTADITFLDAKPKYNGLSSANVTMNADKDIDSIKTHPDCIKRYESITGKTHIPVSCCTTISNSYEAFKQRALLEMVRYLYENSSISMCAHLCFFALKNNYDPVIYNYFISLCFSNLFYSDKHLERFKVANAYASKGSNLKQVQDFFFNLSSTDIEILSAQFLNYKEDNSSEDFEFTRMIYNIQVKMKDPDAALSNFNNRFPKNKYQYLNQPK